MVTLEQVEKLREHANISYDEARAALENADGDILQALIDLERQGKVNPPQGGGQYHSGSIAVSGNGQDGQDTDGTKNAGKDYAKHYAKFHEKHHNHHEGHGNEESAFHHHMRRFFHWVGEIIHKGNVNALVVEKNGTVMMRLPITVLVLLLFFAFWIVVPLLVVGFFFSFRYSFEGPDITSTKVNDAMDSVANAAEEIKTDIRN